MRLHNKAGGKAAKKQRRRTNRPRTTAKIAHRREPSSVDPADRIVLLEHRLNEALEQQTASSEVLSVISSSPGKLEPVFSKMLENAARICEAKFGTLVLSEGGGKFRVVAMHGAPPEWAEKRSREPVFTPGPLNNIAIVARTKRVQHVPDLRLDRSYLEHDAPAMALADIAGARTLVVVPLIKNDEMLGVFGMYRQEVRPFKDKQIELLRTFATQAVIAIENARLLNELRQRTDDLSESLEQQTATSEVLRVISSSPGELEPVFQAMLKNATRICEAKFGTLFRFDGNMFHVAAQVGTPLELAEFQRRRGSFKPGPDTPFLDRVMRTKQVSHTADEAAESVSGPSAKLGGARSLVGVPMLKDDELIGAILIYRQEVRPFTDKQIELVQNFAAQAVIAIENTRLLNETKEALEQQRASAEVLNVISNSVSDAEPVFEKIVESCERIFATSRIGLNLIGPDGLVYAGAYGKFPGAEKLRTENFPHPLPGSATGAAISAGSPIQYPDALNGSDVPQYGRRAAKIVGFRAFLMAPLLSEGRGLGAIFVGRETIGSFSDKEVALLKTFAAQAVIAIENTRLLRELRERTDQLKAQSDKLAELNQQLEQRVGDQVGEIERMSRLRRFLPPQVADLIVASGTEKQLESHRREITALFCDLRGFTGFSESSDPEDVMALLAEYHAAIGTIINKYSGTLERYAGDGVMVIFNDPVPVENPALQAVLMALDMRTSISGLIEKWRDLGHDLGFGIGIAHGFATLGTIGFEGRRDYAAIGTVSNVASRLCDEAKPGQILISPRVRQAVEKAVTIEPVGEFTLKGIRRPMAAYNVLESSPSESN